MAGTPCTARPSARHWPSPGSGSATNGVIGGRGRQVRADPRPRGRAGPLGRRAPAWRPGRGADWRWARGVAPRPGDLGLEGGAHGSALLGLVVGVPVVLDVVDRPPKVVIAQPLDRADAEGVVAGAGQGPAVGVDGRDQHDQDREQGDPAFRSFRAPAAVPTSGRRGGRPRPGRGSRRAAGGRSVRSSDGSTKDQCSSGAASGLSDLRGRVPGKPRGAAAEWMAETSERTAAPADRVDHTSADGPIRERRDMAPNRRARQVNSECWPNLPWHFTYPTPSDALRAAPGGGNRPTPSHRRC